MMGLRRLNLLIVFAILALALAVFLWPPLWCAYNILHTILLQYFSPSLSSAAPLHSVFILCSCYCHIPKMIVSFLRFSLLFFVIFRC